jgi:hypothetical protein
MPSWNCVGSPGVYAVVFRGVRVLRRRGDAAEKEEEEEGEEAAYADVEKDEVDEVLRETGLFKSVVT